MKGKKRPTIGVLVSGIMDEFTEAVCKGIRLASQGSDVNVVVFPGKYLDRDLSENRELMYEYQYNTIFSYARKENVDALIIAAGSIGCLTTKERMDEMLRQYEGIPCVLVASKTEGYVNVTFDNYNGIREAMEYLIHKENCRKFGMIGGPADNSDAGERKQAFMRTLKEHGLEASESLYVEGDFSRRCGEVCNELLSRNPDLEAVFCVNDETAMGFYEELKKRNLFPGKDISVFGYDDTIAAAKAYPPLSSVKADPAEMGVNAFRMVLQMLYGEKVESRVLPTRFVLRDSFRRTVDTVEESGERTAGIENIDVYFDDIFYRYQHEDVKDELNRVRGYFKGLVDKIGNFYRNNERDMELYMDIQATIDAFLNEGIVEYADMDNLLLTFEKVYGMLRRELADPETRFELRDLFSILYRKIIRAMDHQFGEMKEAETVDSYSMKLFIRDMLQFEKGNDQSYASLLGNLDWLKIRNACLYTFEKPMMHLYKENFSLPGELYLKAVLKEGRIASIPALKQRVAIRNIFDNKEIDPGERYYMVLLPLFSNEMLYGVLLCDLTRELYTNGEFLINQMSSAAKMIYLLKTNEQIQQELEESLATLRENNIELDNLSRSDGLTGIYNRRGFNTAAREMLERARRDGKQLLVIYIDMNNLKIINDRYGHDDGDFSLKLIAETITGLMAGRGIAGRIGGDEFACLLEYGGNDEGEALTGELYRRFEAYNETSSKPYNITVSAGAYTLRVGDMLSLEEALVQADEKLYEVKKLRSKEVAKI